MDTTATQEAFPLFFHFSSHALIRKWFLSPASSDTDKGRRVPRVQDTPQQLGPIDTRRLSTCSILTPRDTKLADVGGSGGWVP